MTIVLLSLFVRAVYGASLPAIQPGAERALQLKDYIQKEKPRFEQRETQKRDILEDLDKLNADVNQVRQRISEISTNQSELNMALANLSLEIQRQKSQEAFEEKRLLILFKIVYKIKREGIIRFLIKGDNLSQLANRTRILFHSLRSHARITRELADRAKRLSDNEHRLTTSREEMKDLLQELNDQEGTLAELLTKKHRMLVAINQKQSYFQSALKEFKHISSQLSALFNNFESVRPPSVQIFPDRRTLPLPLQSGKIVKNFGRAVHGKFKTVTFHKGIEIETEENTPVLAVMSGTVEFASWVKGLGNVVIVHHGGGFYSLSAHLLKATQTRGAHVNQGDVIGLVGDSGENEKPSLYFELREHEKAVDPMAYFSPTAVKGLL